MKISPEMKKPIKPNNLVFYATSNRRHVMPREMMENEGQPYNNNFIIRSCYNKMYGNIRRNEGK